MAKITSPITFVGKLGNMVGSKSSRGTALRAYQRNVANPQTLAQLLQRAKVNLCGQISKLTPADAITPLGAGSKALNRSAFMRNLLENTTATQTPAGILAKIPDRSIVFSRGTQQALATASTPTVTATKVSLSLTLRDADYVDIYGERIIVIVTKAEVAHTYEQIFYKDIILNSTSAQSVELTFPVELVENKHIAIYRIPFVLSQQGRALLTDDMIGDDNDITALVQLQNSAIKDWGDTIFLGSTSFTIG